MYPGIGSHRRIVGKTEGLGLRGWHCGGEEKVAAILGALRGGYLNVLITDTVTVQAVLERHESET